MKKYILITTEGTSIAPNENTYVENCQVLGEIMAENPVHAIDRFFNEQPWACQAGFSHENIICKQILSQENKTDLKKIIDYLWNDELKFYQENGYPSDHIFKTLENIKALIS